MELIYRADAREIVLALDLRTDLADAGELLNTYPANEPDLTDEEIDRREEENARRVDLFEAAYLASLREVAAEEHVTVYVGDVTNETETPLDDSGRASSILEHRIWQAAHDRTALPWPSDTE